MRHIASLKVMGEGGEGDPLMPMLFSLGMHPPVRADQTRLRPPERVSAFLDDVCVVCFPERVQTVVSILAAELWNHAHIQVHDGKTQVWNRAGEGPVCIHEITSPQEHEFRTSTQWCGEEMQAWIPVIAASRSCDEFVRTQMCTPRQPNRPALNAR